MTSQSTTGKSFSLSPLRDHARKELVDLLDSVRGKKGLVIDQSLSGPLSLIAEYSLLKEHGVEKIFHLGQDRPEIESKSLIYICRPKIACVKFIASHVQRSSEEGQEIDYNLFFVPRRTLVCEKVLEDAGVYGDIRIGEYHLDLIPLEDDVLSMEMEDSYRELFLEGDISSIYYVAKAIMKFQTVYGVIPRILGKGANAKRLYTLISRMKRELTANEDDDVESLRVFPAGTEVDSIVILDRTVDMVTPLCTQLTYEGLIDEIYGIKTSFVELDAAIVAAVKPGTPAQPAARPKKVLLNGNDRLYSQLRDLNFAVVGSVLNQNARRLQEEIEGRHQARTMTQIKDFIGKLGGLETEKASLKLHTSLAEHITKYTLDQDFNKMLDVQQNLVAGTVLNSHVDYMEEIINKQAPVMLALRLLCLYSLVNGGFKPKNYDFFRREIVQTYGIEHILTLQRLAKIGLLRASEPSINFYAQARKSLKLIVEDVSEQNPNDISYVYSGYAPISVRLVQAACRNSEPPVSVAAPSPAGASASSPILSRAATTVLGGLTTGLQASSSGKNGLSWKGYEEILKVLPGGEFFEESQRVPDSRVTAKRKT
ncbi:hypothetical protein HDU76_011207 [Blyttiomyces sp. JEL0837]|nr:hypothetical protein HDU76_011207 [Blyttiomyces sp. JEL0837]